MPSWEGQSGRAHRVFDASITNRVGVRGFGIPRSFMAIPTFGPHTRMTQAGDGHISSPCYAVLFVSRRTLVDDGYAQAQARMEELVANQPGYLGVRSIRGADRDGITLVFFESRETARAWGQNPEHRAVMQRGRDEWYEDYEIYYAQVERAHSFRKEP